MEKFKKVLKIVLWSLLVACGVSAIVSYAIIPDQTKLFFDGIREFINQPLPIIGVSIVSLFLGVKVILSNTSIGQKALNTMREEITNFKSKVVETKDKAEEYYDKALKTQNETKVIISNYEERFNELYGKLCKVCETMPNAKIKTIGEEIKTQYLGIKNELNEKLDNIDEYIEEKKSEFDYKGAYEEMADRLAKLEKDYGEREEAING